MLGSFAHNSFADDILGSLHPDHVYIRSIPYDIKTQPTSNGKELHHD